MSDLESHPPVLLPLADWRHSAHQVCKLVRELKDTKLVFEMVSMAVCLPDKDAKPLRFHNAELRKSPTWKKHEAMWKGYEWHLSMYAMMLLEQLSETVALSPSSREAYDHYMLAAQRNFVRAEKTNEPWWFGESFFHESHQSWLKRKCPDAYRHYFFKTPDCLPLVWPPHEPGKRRVL